MQANTKAIAITCKANKTINLEDVVAFQGELKEISRKNLERLKNRILKNGFNVPFFIWSSPDGKQYLLDGHQRTRALYELKTAGYNIPPLPYAEIQADSIEDAKDKLLGISSQYGDFTQDGIRAFMGDMKIDGDIRLTTGELKIESAKAPEEEIGDDDIPDKAPKICKVGDVWDLGTHRLMVADCTDKAAVDRLFEGLAAQLVFTDPPYGVDYEGADGGILNDEKKGVELEKGLLAPSFKLAAKHAVEDAAFYVWHASSTRTSFERALVAAGLEEKQYIIWVKPAAVMGRSLYHWQHEPCFLCAKHGNTPRWTGDRKQTTVWTVTLRTEGSGFVAMTQGVLLTDNDGSQVYIHKEPPKNKKTRAIRIEKNETILLSGLDGTDVWEVNQDNRAEYIHPNQKPVELSIRAITNHTEPGEIVYDAFTGSGSTLIGCERTGRAFRGTELDKHWADRIIKRWILWKERHHQPIDIKRNGEAFDFRKFIPEMQ